jgi:hypothetical protein
VQVSVCRSAWKIVLLNGPVSAVSVVAKSPTRILSFQLVSDSRRMGVHRSWLEYPVTQPFTLPYLTSTLIIAGVLWSSFVTLITFATVGYESIVIQSSSFNETDRLWYEKFLPSSQWTPGSKICDVSYIKNTDGISPLWQHDCNDYRPYNS